MNHPSGESIWGNINTALEIALNIYVIVATDENGVEREGIMVPKDKAKEILSDKAISMAEQDGDKTGIGSVTARTSRMFLCMKCFSGVWRPVSAWKPRQ